jgi:hypothetical protein
MNRTTTFLTIFLVFLIISCEKINKSDPVKSYKEYYPLKIGNYIIYNVDSTSFEGKLTKFNYELKDIITDTFSDQEKRLNYRIERFQKDSNSESWKLRNVWTATFTDDKLINFEQNINYVRLIFPINSKQKWNLNAYNSLSVQNASYSDIHKSFKMGTIFVDSSVTIVEKADTSNLISNEFQKRVYGFDIGLIYYYKDSLQLEFNPQRKGDTIGGYRLQFVIKEYN